MAVKELIGASDVEYERWGNDEHYQFTYLGKRYIIIHFGADDKWVMHNYGNINDVLNRIKELGK